MTDTVLHVADGVWNIRGSFKIGGVLDIGTHATLVRRANGRFLMLDAYTLAGEVKRTVDALTNNGADIDAIINLHPFHTVHCRAAHAQYPQAKLFGTRRHHDKLPDLPWEPELTESQDCAARFADDLAFTVPRGVDFIARSEHLHFASVLAYHRASKTLHVDDTLMLLRLPGPLGRIKPPQVTFHPTLSRTLERRAGAADDFRDWARALTTEWHDAENLCAAHTAALLGRDNTGAPIAARIDRALGKVERSLRAHARKHG